MPTVNLDELLPEPTVYMVDGQTYTLAADLPIDLTVELIRAIGEAGDAEAKGDLDAIRATNDRLAELVLAAFQVSDPELEALPFGIVAYRVIVGQLLAQLGVLIEADGGASAKPNRAARRSAPRKRS